MANVYYLEDLSDNRYVVYVVEQGQEGRLLKTFPDARRTTRARAVQLCRTQGRSGDWCMDAQSEMAAARELGGDLDIEEAKKATDRAIELHEEYLKETAVFAPLLDLRRPRSLAQSPPR